MTLLFRIGTLVMPFAVYYPTMTRSPFLSDVRQIGPGSEQNISGVCSSCKATLFARLDEKNPTQAQLRASLNIVFERHLVREHTNDDVSTENDVRAGKDPAKLDTA